MNDKEVVQQKENQHEENQQEVESQDVLQTGSEPTGSCPPQLTKQIINKLLVGRRGAAVAGRGHTSVHSEATIAMKPRPLNQQATSHLFARRLHHPLTSPHLTSPTPRCPLFVRPEVHFLTAVEVKACLFFYKAAAASAEPPHE